MITRWRSGKKHSRKWSEWEKAFGKWVSSSGSLGVGPIAAHVFSAIIEEPGRFKTRHQFWKYSGLGITDRTSDNKPLGYQRLDRRGNHELKNLSYHAWRTACKSTTGPNAIKAFYHQSRQRTGSVRHARLNTQRKILETMWLMWRRQKRFEPQKFALKTD